MENMSKNTKIALGAIVLVIIVAIIVRYGLGKKVVPETVIPEPIAEETTTVAPRPRGTKAVVTPEPIVDTRSYAELILAYKDRTIQFGKDCQVRASDQVYKLGGEVLLDNRNDFPVLITFGGISYNLGGYGHQVVTLNSEGKFMVECNANKNVVTVTVQK